MSIFAGFQITFIQTTIFDVLKNFSENFEIK